jgi:hypothetical protein
MARNPLKRALRCQRQHKLGPNVITTGQWVEVLCAEIALALGVRLCGLLGHEMISVAALPVMRDIMDVVWFQSCSRFTRSDGNKVTPLEHHPTLAIAPATHPAPECQQTPLIASQAALLNRMAHRHSLQPNRLINSWRGGSLPMQSTQHTCKYSYVSLC